MATTAFFEEAKEKILSDISAGIDFSPKGNIDIPILDLVNFINRLPNYVTTSSCSGRISCYYSSSTKGIEWKLVKHRTIQLEELIHTLDGLGQDDRLLMLKCEPSIIHVLCKDLSAAHKLHQLAFSCGYRESGIGIGKKIMVAIRTTAFSLEVPLLLEAKNLVTNEGLKVLVHECNDRLIRNFSRIQRLLDALKKSEGWPAVLPSKPTSNFEISRVIKNRSEEEPICGEFSSLSEISAQGIQHLAVMKWKRGRDHLIILSGGRKSFNCPLPCVWSLALIDRTNFTSSLQFTQTGDIPAARWGHTLCQFDSRRLLLIGGRNKDFIFNDAFFLEIGENISSEIISFVWTEIISLPRPAFYHAACYLGESRGVLVSGGLSDRHLKSFEQDDGTPATNLLLMKLPRSLSNDNPLSEELDEPTNDLLNRLQWVSVELPQNGRSRFGHSINSIGAQTLIILGGSSLDPLFSVSPHSVELWDLIYEQHLNCSTLSVHISLRTLPLSSPEWKLGFGCRSHHFSISFGDHLYIFGGKLRCEALFGSWTAEPVELRFLSSELLETPRISSILFSKPSLLIPFYLIKQVKTYLESQKWLDKGRRINSPSEQDLVKVLEVEEINNIVISNTKDISGDGNILANWKAIPVRSEFMNLIPIEATLVSDLKSFLPSSVPLYFLDEQRSCPSKAILVSSHLKAIQYLKELIPRITQHRFPNNIKLQTELAAQLRKDIPNKFEFVGNVIMIPEESLLIADWAGVSKFSDLLQKLLDIFNESSVFKGLGNKYNRIARKSQIDPGPMRESRVRILHSLLTTPSTEEVSLSDAPGWVELVENKILYGFDITKVMFCSGNVTERMRMAQYVNPMKKSETIVDLYAGIGYYTLPFLLGTASALKVHACEWNPNSVAALEYNLRSAGIMTTTINIQNEDLSNLNLRARCNIFKGNNQISASKNGPLFHVADRVCLGLLPSSVDGWPLAVNVLKAEGGILHVHENVRDRDIDQWVENCCNCFTELFAEADRNLGSFAGRPMKVTWNHIERVKSFSPHVIHIVVDLLCARSEPN